jgi:hypothetical protein
MTSFPEPGSDDPVSEKLRQIGGSLRPSDGGRRERFLALVAVERARAPVRASRLRGWRRRFLLAAGAGGLVAASLVGVTAAGGVDEAIDHLEDTLSAAPFFGRADEEPTPAPRPASRPLETEWPESGIDTSNASDTGREHANPNAVDGSSNADDRGENRQDGLPSQAEDRTREGDPQRETTPGPPEAAPQRGPRAR